MPTVSVIIPIYNKAKRLRYSIESVLNQLFSDFELILINDGSTDSSHEIAIEYKNRDSRIIYIEQSNQGVSDARNNGINLAKGKYISFLDADDQLHKECLAELINGIGHGNVCYCGHYYFTNGDRNKPIFKFVEGDILESYLYNKCTPNTNSWLIKKSFLNKYDIRFSSKVSWGEDMIFFSKILFNDMNVKCVKKYLTEYHMSDENSLSENSIDKIHKDIFWMEEIMKYFYRNESDKNRTRKMIKAIKSYRIPGSIIYRINLNHKKIGKEEIKKLLKPLYKYIDKIEYTNGLRSLKLHYYKYKIVQFIKT